MFTYKLRPSVRLIMTLNKSFFYFGKIHTFSSLHSNPLCRTFAFSIPKLWPAGSPVFSRLIRFYSYSSSMTGPRILFGGAAIGEAPFATTEEVQSLLNTLKICRITHVDSAAIYPMSAQGTSEQLLGDSQASQLGFTIDTKIKAIGPGPGRGSLKPSALDESINSSLTRLKTEVPSLHLEIV